MGSRNRRLQPQECPRHLSIFIKSWFALHTPTTTTTTTYVPVCTCTGMLGTPRNFLPNGIPVGQKKNTPKAGTRYCPCITAASDLRRWRTRSPRGCPAMLRAETENVRAAKEGAKNMMRQALPRSQRGALITPS